MLYTTSIAVGQMSGSLNGTVASHNRFGKYFRDRAIPVNPQSERQGLVRNIFATMTNAWANVLTQAQRDAWQVYANNITWKNKLGEDIILTGLNMFIRGNCIADRAAFPLVPDGPVIFTLADTDPNFVVTASEATQTLAVVFNDTKDWCSEDEAGMQVMMSQPVAGSVGYITPTYRYADMMPGDSVAPMTSPNNVLAPFPIATGQQVQCTGRILRADGRLSNMFLDAVVVAA